MLQPISDLFGWMMGYVYNSLAKIMAEPAQVSFFAMTILVMALISKLIMIPLMAKSTQSSQKMQELGPKVEALKKKYGYDERILQEKTQELYKSEGISAMGCSSCLPMVLQLVLIFALFAVLKDPAKYMTTTGSSFHSIAKNFFWIPDLLKSDPLSWFGLPLIYLITQVGIMFFGPMRQQQTGPNKNMGLMFQFMPVIFYFMSISWASGLLLYWASGNVLELIYRGISALFFRSKKHTAVEGGKK